MCKQCLVEIRPDVETHTSDSGANMLNFKGCTQCNAVTMLKAINLVKEVDDDEDNDQFSEEIRFQRMFLYHNH